MGKLRFVRQLDAMDCGPACLNMIAGYYGCEYSLEYLRKITSVGRNGVSMLGLKRAAELIGMKVQVMRITSRLFSKSEFFPCIVYWDQKHFVVVYKCDNKRIHVADPGLGRLSYTWSEFNEHWLNGTDRDGNSSGIVMSLRPTEHFGKSNVEVAPNKNNLYFLWNYFKQQSGAFIKLLFALFIVSAIQLLFPFLTQAIVDKGINGENLNIVYLILLAEVALLSGSTIIDFFRRRVFLKVSTLVDISLISDFFIKLMKLPMKFFCIKLPGDILQRIEDHARIENFLTDQSPRLVFSAFNIVTFSFVLAFYSWRILIVFILGNLLYVLWILLFLNRRRILDYQYFEKQANQRDVVYQMITGMPEIKLQGCERRKREQWRKIQEDIFGINLKSLTLNQYEEAGGIFITELTNIVIVIIAATSVISGNITLGVMLAVQSVIGQLRAPMDDIMSFIYQWQDVNISMERINEIHSMKNDEEEYGNIRDINDVNIDFHNVSFQYDLSEEKNVLNHITLRIPQNKITAIVGASGSGKTTLVKLLLGHFLPTKGYITIGGTKIQDLDLRWWRSQCGAVMQDGVIFPESIAQNIGLTDSTQDSQGLVYAANKACILDYVNSLPLGFNTILYQDGMNLSNGQRQRILIARAIYRNPRLFVFDEATNSLDADTESEIVRNLKTVFQNRTVVVIAHRLSTVRDADNIIVLDQGTIIEQGNHEVLLSIKGYYYGLVKNQLEG